MKVENFFDEDPEALASRLVSQTYLKTGSNIPLLAKKMGKGEDLLYKWANPNNPTANIQLAQAIKLIQITRNFTILEELARAFGFRLVPVNGDTSQAVEAIKKLVEALEK